MRITRSAAGAAALLTALAARGVEAQNANLPTRTLATPDVEFDEPFSRLMGIRELTDGRVIVSDMTEKFIAMLDLGKGSMTKIGHEGNGPGEYTIPAAVYAMPGDTTLVSDMMGRKYIKVTPAGTLAPDVMLASPASSGGGGGVRSFSIGGIGGAADASGRIYAMGSPIQFGADGSIVPSDSAAITRFDVRSGRTDTVTFVKVAPPQIQQTGSAGGRMTMAVRMGPGSQPFTTQQAWTVAPDGRIALVSPEPYRVTWIAPGGARTVGQPIPYQRVRVTEAEKEAYRENARNNPPTAVSMTRGSGGNSVSTSSAPYTEPASWPEFKHPFSGSSNNVVVAPSGELWILRQLAHTERNPTYDVVGARGELMGRVVLQPRSRLLGFGRNGTVYTVRRDDDDLEYIQRHRMSQGR